MFFQPSGVIQIRGRNVSSIFVIGSKGKKMAPEWVILALEKILKFIMRNEPGSVLKYWFLFSFQKKTAAFAMNSLLLQNKNVQKYEGIICCNCKHLLCWLCRLYNHNNNNTNVREVDQNIQLTLFLHLEDKVRRRMFISPVLFVGIVFCQFGLHIHRRFVFAPYICPIVRNTRGIQRCC